MPQKTMESYKQELLAKLDVAVEEQKITNAAKDNAAVTAFTVTDAIPKNIKIDRLDGERKVMNRIMQRFVEQVRMDPKAYILDRPPVDRLCNKPPQIFTIDQKPVFFKDKDFSYGKNFLLGMDFDFLMLEAAVLSLMN